ARLTKSPAMVYLVVSIIPLVPGGDIYRTMVYFIEGKADLFLGLFMYALSIAGSIALGVFAVTSIFRLFSSIMKKLKKKKI
ncbi:MAG TPA: threonine/serine exporter family protein, partial [Oscillospiraceae bacterium]|nr:threonine/serine exporter family protein [Oscillospiraceae bacterium]